MIKTDLLVTYNIRFETFRYQTPSFSNNNSDPLEIIFAGGCVGFVKIPWENLDLSPLNIFMNIDGSHYLYTSNSWTYISTQRSYQITDYEYIWFGSDSQKTITQGTVNYGST